MLLWVEASPWSFRIFPGYQIAQVNTGKYPTILRKPEAKSIAGTKPCIYKQNKEEMGPGGTTGIIPQYTALIWHHGLVHGLHGNRSWNSAPSLLWGVDSSLLMEKDLRCSSYKTWNAFPPICGLEMHLKSQKNHSHEQQGQAKQNSLSTSQELTCFLISFSSYCRIHLGWRWMSEQSH